MWELLFLFFFSAFQPQESFNLGGTFLKETGRNVSNPIGCFVHVIFARLYVHVCRTLFAVADSTDHGHFSLFMVIEK